MPSTPNLALPYPAQSAPADVPADMQALAVKLDAVIPTGVQTPSPIFLARGATSAGPSGVGSGGFWMSANDGSSIANGGSTTVPPAGAFQWDPAAYPAAPAGLTAKWRVMAYLYTNGTSPGTVTFFVGWRRFSTSGATGGVAYTMFGSDTELRQATIANPTGGFAAATADLAVPVTSPYAATFSWSGTTAANSWTHVFTKLYLVYV